MIYFLLLVSLCILVFLSDLVRIGTYDGLLLWFNVLIPSILPAMLLSSLIKNENIDKKINQICHRLLCHILPANPNCYFAILFSLLSGIPTASAISYDLFKKNTINYTELKYLLILTSNPGINFIINYIYIYIFQRQFSLSYLLLLIYTPQLLIALFYYLKNKQLINKNAEISKIDILKFSFEDIIMKCAKSLLTIGIYIIIFSILQKILIQFLPSSNYKTFAISLTEITTGLNYIKTYSGSNPFFIITCVLFTGFSSIFQIFTVCENDIKVLFFVIKTKILSTGLALSIYLINQYFQ